MTKKNEDGQRHWISGSITAAMNTEAITRERDIKESLADMDIPNTWLSAPWQGFEIPKIFLKVNWLINEVS